MTADDLRNWMNANDLNQAEFADLIGAENASKISKWLKIDGEFGDQMERNIRKSMQLAETKLIPTIPQLSAKPKSEPVHAGRTNTPHFLEDVVEEILEMLMHLDPATYKSFPVQGTSMTPTIFEGDKLICRTFQLDKVINGRVYVIRTTKGEIAKSKSGGLVVKRCYLRDHHLTCKSDNKETTDPFFTFQLKRNEISEVWEPVLRLTGNLGDPNRDVYERLDELEGRIEMLESLSGEM